MGLSDEERRTGLYYDIHSIVEHADSLKEIFKREPYFTRRDYDKFLNQIDQLWHAFLGNTRNGAHWILGSSASNEVDWGTGSPWGVAINHHCDDIFKEKSEWETAAEKGEEFDAFEGFLDIEGLLRAADPRFSHIYNIYAMSEQVVYHLRRYEDDFSAGLESLSKLISDIQGECFGFFKKKEAFARAYVLHAACKLIYGNIYPYQKDKWDVVTQFIQTDCGHHNLNRLMTDGSLKEIAELHDQLYRAEKSKKLTKLLRLQAFLKLSGRRFHYDHTWKKLEEALKKDRFKAADIASLKTIFKKNQADHETHEKESQESYLQNQYSPLSIYGDIMIDERIEDGN